MQLNKQLVLPVLAYLSFLLIYFYIIFVILLVTLLIIHQNSGNRLSIFHMRQAFGIALISFIWFVMTDYIPVAWGWILSLVPLTLAIIGLYHLLRKKKNQLPFLGPYFQEWLKFIQ